MFFTVEPMINAGRYEVKVLDDGWTAVTRDRSLSAQFEHTVAVTADGYEIFTARPPGSIARPIAADGPPRRGRRRRRQAGLSRPSPALARPLPERQATARSQDYELLELLLAQAQKRIDSKPIAKALIKRFGSFAGVMAAQPDQLQEVDDVGPAATVIVKVVQACALRMAQRGGEQARGDRFLEEAARLSAAWPWPSRRPSSSACSSSTTRTRSSPTRSSSGARVNHTPVYPREVVKRALELGASAIILVHNHPSGDPTPSQDDIAMTKEVAAAADKLGISVHDHIIIGRKGHASLRSLGHL